MVIELNQIISHYKIISKLGAGGMGEVYLAEDTKLPRKVALKFLALSYANFPEYKARFKREAEVMASIHIRTLSLCTKSGNWKTGRISSWNMWKVDRLAI